MAVTVAASGTQVATVGVEHTLTTETDARTYVAVVDLVNMVAQDEVLIRVKSKVLSGGATQDTYRARFGPTPPTNKTVISIPVPSTHEVIVTLTQTAGTSRNFPWEVRILD